MVHLKNRNGIYYYRSVIAPNARKVLKCSRELSFSLGTYSLLKARKSTRIYDRYIYLITKAVDMKLNQGIIDSLVDSFMQAKIDKSIKEHSLYDKKIDIDFADALNKHFKEALKDNAFPDLLNKSNETLISKAKILSNSLDKAIDQDDKASIAQTLLEKHILSLNYLISKLDKSANLVSKRLKFLSKQDESYKFEPTGIDSFQDNINALDEASGLPLNKEGIKNLTKNFGGLTAVGDVSMELNEGELVGLIGPNGAGKTTLFNLLTGVYEPSEGTVTLDGTVLNGKAPYKIASLGLSRTFQNIRLFKDMTVLENVLVGLSNKQPSNFFASLLRLPKYYSSEEELKAKAMKLLAIFNLDGEADTLAKNLAYGQQRHLEIVRALATEPKILFLDEPAAGMNPQETAELTQLIRRIQKEFNITIMLIEHDMSLVMDVTERIYVLEYGRLIAEGTPDEIKNNKRVIEAYLGGEA